MFARGLLVRLGLDLDSYGYIERQKGRSIVILASDPDAVSTISDLLKLIRQRYPRNRIAFFAKTAAERERLSEQFPGDRILDYPRSSGHAHGRTICKLNTQLLLIVGIPDTDLTRWLDQALKAETAVVMIEDGKPLLWQKALLGWVARACLQKITLFINQEPGSADALLAAGVASENIHSLDRADDSRQETSKRLIERLVPALSTKKKPTKYWRTWLHFSPVKIKKLLMDGAFGRWLITRQYRLIASLPELRENLGHPKSILCLGNGPSSEEPAIGAIAHDCLFRVNHRWRDRGLLIEPDMVFTGNRTSIGMVGPKVIFGLQDMAAERRLTLECLGIRKRLSLSTIECLEIVDVAAFSGFRPTNGAVMLATAVALAPERLIVAGIDLFDHPGGSYPGDSETPNAYTIGHDRTTELRFILETLDRYHGELIIHGEVLAEHWQRHKAKHSRSAGSAARRSGMDMAASTPHQAYGVHVDVSHPPSSEWSQIPKLAGSKP